LNKIAVIGAGYVGLSNAVLLAKKNQVFIVDIDQHRIDMLSRGICPLDDPLLGEGLVAHLSNITAGTNLDVVRHAEFVIISLPTNYDEDQGKFDTAIIEDVIGKVIEINPAALVVIKSTVPVGFTSDLAARLGVQNIVFSPEFLREGQALNDNLHPSRIVVGGLDGRERIFAQFLLDGAEASDVPIVITGSIEAEAIKLFSNTYLAMRVAFFNELDNFGMQRELDMRKLLLGMGYDARIGGHYMNPSFGYGGYCLPKDTKQAVSTFGSVPNNIIRAIVESNQTRKIVIANTIASRGVQKVGIYKLAMKLGSDNFRSAAILDIIDILSGIGIEIAIFEPSINESWYQGFKVFSEKSEFFDWSECIVANRWDDELHNVRDKVFCRDEFRSDE
jgi:UDPglucose 6-dehydrogenase